GHVVTKISTVVASVLPVVPKIPMIFTEIAPVLSYITTVLRNFSGAGTGSDIAPQVLPISAKVSTIFPDVAPVSTNVPSVLAEITPVFPYISCPFANLSQERCLDGDDAQTQTA
ncbi:MAG TPA: hypothetical protein VFD86_02335, partial [Nitrospira sp.]|nr:hypothetical protein [Nitrospira sp.]